MTIWRVCFCSGCSHFSHPNAYHITCSRHEQVGEVNFSFKLPVAPACHECMYSGTIALDQSNYSWRRPGLVRKCPCCGRSAKLPFSSLTVSFFVSTGQSLTPVRTMLSRKYAKHLIFFYLLVFFFHKVVGNLSQRLLSDFFLFKKRGRRYCGCKDALEQLSWMPFLF